MKLRERDEPLDPEVERDLDAVDRALAGRPVDPGPGRLAELTAAAHRRAARTSMPSGRSELDRRETPRGFRRGGEGDALRKLAGRVGMRPGRMLAPAGALATLRRGRRRRRVDAGAAGATRRPRRRRSGRARIADSSGDDGGELGRPAALADLTSEGSQPVTGSRIKAQRRAVGTRRDLRATSRSRQIAPGTEKRQGRARRDALPLDAARRGPRDLRRGDLDHPLARRHRRLLAGQRGRQAAERDARADACRRRNLDSAIDRLTELANVESLNEATDRHHQALRHAPRTSSGTPRPSAASCSRRSATPTTDAEAEALRLQIDDARREISRAEAAFENIARRARLSDLSVTIVGDPNAQEDRSIGDWVDDAVTSSADVAGRPADHRRDRGPARAWSR